MEALQGVALEATWIKKKNAHVLLKETDFFPLFQLTLESKVYFTFSLSRIKAEPIRTIAVVSDDKCQIKILADMEDTALFFHTHYPTLSQIKFPYKIGLQKHME